MAEHLPLIFPSPAPDAVAVPACTDHQDTIDIKADDYYKLEAGKNVLIQAGDENILVIAGVDKPVLSGDQEHVIMLVAGYGDPDDSGLDIGLPAVPRSGIAIVAASTVILKAPLIKIDGNLHVTGDVLCDKVVTDSTGVGVSASNCC